MADNPIKLVNENGRIVGKDPQNGDTIPVEFKSLVSDKGVLEQRLHAVYEANTIRAEAGVPALEPTGLESGEIAGLSDAGTLTAEEDLFIQSESDASNAAASGSGTEGDPYVIRDRNMDNSEGSGNGINWDDSGADYYIRLENCHIREYTNACLRVKTGTELTVRHCLVKQNPGKESGFAGELTVDRLLGAVVLIEEWRKTRSTVGVEICIECFMRNRNS